MLEKLLLRAEIFKLVGQFQGQNEANWSIRTLGKGLYLISC